MINVKKYIKKIVIINKNTSRGQSQKLVKHESAKFKTGDVDMKNNDTRRKKATEQKYIGKLRN